MKCRSRGSRTLISHLPKNLDQKIDNLDFIHQPAISSQQDASHSRQVSTLGAVSGSANLRPSKEAIDELYAKLNECEIKGVALSFNKYV